jgi:hypothetical protein
LHFASITVPLHQLLLAHDLPVGAGGYQLRQWRKLRPA